MTGDDDDENAKEDVTAALRTALHGEPGETLGRIRTGTAAAILATWHAAPRSARPPFLMLALHVQRRDGTLEPHPTRRLRFERGRELRQLGAAVVRALERAERGMAAPENEAEK